MAETIGAIIIAAVEAATATAIPATILGVSTASIVGSAAIIGAAIGLQYALRPSLPKPEDGSQPIKQAVPPRIMGYGRNRLAGYYMLFEEYGGTSYDVMAFHSGRIGGVVDYYLHDDRVSLKDPALTGGFGSYVLGGDDGRYGNSHVTIQQRLGEDLQNPAFFVDAEGISSVWTTAHKGSGIAWAALVCKGAGESDYGKYYPRGLPVLSVIADCAVVWDPRDGTQSRNDPSTWKVSQNPIIQLMDYLTRADGGLGLDYATIIEPVLNDWMVEAYLCDEAVLKADGTTEFRYRSSIWFQFDNKPEDIINGILSTCDGWLSENGDGTFSVVVGVYREPTVTLTEKHILAFGVSYGQPDEQTVNQLDITFTDPAQGYITVQTETWRDEDAISLNGVVRSQPLNLSWVQSNSQARRLAGRAMQRLNPAASGTFTTTLYGLAALGKRWIKLKYPFVSGLQDCVVEIQAAELDLMAGRVNFTFNLIGDDIEAYDPEADEGRAPVIPPTLTPADTLPVPKHVESSLIGSSEAGYRLLVTFDDPLRGDLSYVVRYRVGDSDPWVEVTGNSSNAAGTNVSITTGFVDPGETYVIQAATVGPKGTRSEWSLLPVRADSTIYRADNNIITADNS
ncbi:MAG: phage tail protein [Xanthobacteraceae bacterium]